MNRHYRNNWIELPIFENEQIARDHGLSVSLYSLLKNRMADSEIASFLDPDLSSKLIPGSKEASEVIQKAIREGRRIMIFGDYDVDGMTSSALLSKALISLGASPVVVLPNRYDHGYGLSEKSLSLIKDTDLLITVDCGITSLREVEILKSRGVEVVITDHHEPAESLPDCILVNPKLGYRFPSLAGVGVVLKLLQAMGIPLTGEYYQLAMLGTISDVMPLRGENRWFVKQGLASFYDAPLAGMEMLLKVLGLRPEALKAQDIAFKIVPLFNAAGRMGDPYPGFLVLTSKDPETVKEAVEVLLRDNARRKETQQEMVSLISKDSDLLIYIDKNPAWLTGILGIASAKAVETLRRPVILFREEGETLKGSARSLGDFHILEAIRSCEDLLIRFGGHRQAAGIELLASDYELFIDRMQEYAKIHLKPEDLKETIFYLPLEPADIRPRILDEMESLEPYGAGFEAPVFGLRNYRLEEVKLLGERKNVYRLEGSASGRPLSVISFHRPPELLKLGESYDLLVYLQKNTFRGITKVDLHLKDIRFSVPTLSPSSPGFQDDLRELTKLLRDSSEVSEVCKALRDNPLFSDGYRVESFFRSLPTRQSLSAYYKAWKSEPFVEWIEQNDVLEVQFSRKIFEELNLISYTDKANGFLVVLPEKPEKRQLTDSLLYRQANKLKEAYFEP